jgi:hypothetical protein
MAAAGVLAGLSGFAVAGPVGVLVAARASPRRRLLAAVTPAYVASLRLRATRLEGQPAWQAADYTAHPHGHGYGAALRDRLQRLATADGRAIVLTAANRDRAGTGSNDLSNNPTNSRLKDLHPQVLPIAPGCRDDGLELADLVMGDTDG